MTKRVLLDSNLLLLLLVGAASPNYIKMHKRLRDVFTESDYDILLGEISDCEVVLTPNTLTETSNLLAHIGEPARSNIRVKMNDLIGGNEEFYIESYRGSSRDEFFRLGLTDSIVLELMNEFSHKKDPAILLTVDLELYLSAIVCGYKAVNFNHIRQL